MGRPGLSSGTATVGCVSEADAPVEAKPKVRWGRVALFYLLALGWVSLIAAVLFVTGRRDVSGGGGISVLAIVLAALAMPAPLVAALIVGRLDRRPALIRTTFDRFWRKLPRLVLVVVLVIAALLLGMLGLTWVLGNLLGLSGAGRVLFAQPDLLANALLLFPSMDVEQVAKLNAAIPSLWPLLGLSYAGALVAGFTVNGVFAFGEEYGWRGWLADELRPLGAFWANLLTGVLWGVWHAPLILLGYNYAGYAVLGTAFMIAWCVPASFLLWRARQVTDSLIAPAALHGGINGFAGVFLLVLVDTNPLIAAPMGLAGTAAVAVVAGGFWWLARKRAGRVE